tara:strand:+ start:1457 stop:1645 length:189 start_codon:yes stop_codon:yes gene_type:complete
MQIGDLVMCWPHGTSAGLPCSQGVVIGFNEKGEGGKDFVQVFCNGAIMTFLSFEVEVINESQ